MRPIRTGSRNIRANPWLRAWARIAKAIEKLNRNHPCYTDIATTLDRCDQCFADDDWGGFEEASRALLYILKSAEQGRLNEC